MMMIRCKISKISLTVLEYITIASLIIDTVTLELVGTLNE